MNINTYMSKILDTNCYLVEQNGLAIVIDPCVEKEIVLKRTNSKLVGVFITHGHYDHFNELKSYLNEDIKIFMRKSGFDKLEDGTKNCSLLFGKNYTVFVPTEKREYLEDCKKISFSSDFVVEVLTTPGHTDCGVVLLIEDAMFSGDTLFRHTVGRTDLYSSNSAELLNSLRKIIHLPINYDVFPGHGENTSIAEEKIYNTYVKRIK